VRGPHHALYICSEQQYISVAKLNQSRIESKQPKWSEYRMVGGDDDDVEEEEHQIDVTETARAETTKAAEEKVAKKKPPLNLDEDHQQGSKTDQQRFELELKKQASDEIQAHVESILRLVGCEKEDTSSVMNNEKKKAAASSSTPVDCYYYPAKKEAKLLSQHSDNSNHSKKDCADKPQVAKGGHGSAGTARTLVDGESELASSTAATGSVNYGVLPHPPQMAFKIAPQRMIIAGESSSFPPELGRDMCLAPQPGALRMAGILLCPSSSDDDFDSGIFPHNGQSGDGSEQQGYSEFHHRSIVTANNTDDPIRAILVEEDLAIEAERERDLAEREAGLKRREQELESKMQQLMEGPAAVVEAQTVSVADKDERASPEKKRGFGSIFKILRPKQSSKGDEILNSVASQHAETAILTEASAAFALLSNAKEPGSLINALVEKKLAPAHSWAHSESPNRLSRAEFLKGLCKKVDMSIPFFGLDEVNVGKRLGSGKYNSVVSLKSLELSGTWETTEIVKNFSADIVDLQKRLRRDMVNKSKRSKPKYVVKCLRSDLYPRSRALATAELRAEANLLSTLDHPNVISVRAMAPDTSSDMIPNNSSLFYVMDQLEHTLFDCITRSWRRRVKGPQFFLDRVKIATNLAAAIDYMHYLNIMYCDLKPENLGIDHEGSTRQRRHEMVLGGHWIRQQLL
jgi:hypothetical protein